MLLNYRFCHNDGLRPSEDSITFMETKSSEKVGGGSAVTGEIDRSSISHLTNFRPSVIQTLSMKSAMKRKLAFEHYKQYDIIIYFTDTDVDTINFWSK